MKEKINTSGLGRNCIARTINEMWKKGKITTKEAEDMLKNL